MLIAQQVSDFNTLISFLARRDIKCLSSKELDEEVGIPKADLLILLGNSSLFVAEQAAGAVKQGLAKSFMICGGKGHSTRYLAENVQNHPQFNNIKVDDRAEAEILRDILVRHKGLAESDILLESQSTNCGANAQEAYKLLEQRKESIKSILLMQDPVLQLRSSLSFGKVWGADSGVSFISYAAFVPNLKVKNGIITYADPAHFEFCNIVRFLSLVMGEIPRLRDDKEGYGPRGKGFIQHIYLPEDVLHAYERLLPHYGQYLRER